MNSFLDNDLLFLIGFIILLKIVEDLAPWITIAGGIIVIIAGIYKIINLHLSIMERKQRLKQGKS